MNKRGTFRRVGVWEEDGDQVPHSVYTRVWRRCKRPKRTEERRGGLRAAGSLEGRKSSRGDPAGLLWAPPPQNPPALVHHCLLQLPPSAVLSLPNWEISKTGTPWDPCLAFHLHQFPQEEKKSLDDLPVAEMHPHYSHSSQWGLFCPLSAVGVMTGH